ncbi:hypothetical protein [uncultured Rikenella sp.]|uniref:hypothetical protein n=1 Tax=uncultured Rikenella sp. TaxID=368003 RepID=UPI00272A0D4C|nr:hypothetical protein [uncultured Rikenella sp.]
MSVVRVPNDTAPGYRGYGDGKAWNVGDGGFGFSPATSPREEYACCITLNFGVQRLNPTTLDSRGFGLQLRCLSE